jgi:hypothetical protein
MPQRPKRGQSRLSPQRDQHVDRLRREVEEEFRHLSIADVEQECCVAVRLDGEDIGDEHWLNFIAGDGVEIEASVDTANNEIDVTISAPGAAGAPLDASYVTIGLNATLSDERVLTAGTAITLTDGGANGNATIGVTAGGIGTTQLANDGVTYAKIQNVTTNRLLGRDTAGSGDVEELTLGAGLGIGVAGAGTVSLGEWGECAVYGNATDVVDTVPVEISATDNGTYLGRRSDVLSFHAVSITEVEGTLYEVNFSTLANNTLVDGAETIDGLAYVAANMAELGTAAVQNGTGIRMVAAASNGGAVTMNTTSQLIPYIYVPLSQIAGYNPTAAYIIEIYCPARVLEANGEYVALGLWGVVGAPFASSDARMRAAKLVRNAGDTADVMRVTQNATDDTGDVDISTHNVIAIKLDGTGIGQAFSGTWSGGWPTSYTGHSLFPTAPAADSPMNTGDVRLFMGLGCVNDASPTTSVTIERMRIRRAF